MSLKNIASTPTHIHTHTHTHTQKLLLDLVVVILEEQNIITVDYVVYTCLS